MQVVGVVNVICYEGQDGEIVLDRGLYVVEPIVSEMEIGSG